MKINIKKAPIAAMLAIGCGLTLNTSIVRAQESTVQQQTLAKGDKAPDFSLKDFTLLSDPDNVVLNKFGVKEQDFGNVKVSGRETFVIDLNGKIVYSFRDFMKGDEHSRQVLTYLKAK